jgi:hypothetical protein
VAGTMHRGFPGCANSTISRRANRPALASSWPRRRRFRRRGRANTRHTWCGTGQGLAVHERHRGQQSAKLVQLRCRFLRHRWRQSIRTCCTEELNRATRIISPCAAPPRRPVTPGRKGIGASFRMARLRAPAGAAGGPWPRVSLKRSATHR